MGGDDRRMNGRAAGEPVPDGASAPVPLWLRIAQSIERDIAAGRLSGGARMESEHRLAMRFAVNRHTVRRAIGHLTAKGAVRVQKGRGSFVEEHAIDYVLGPGTRFSENLGRAGLAARHVLIDAATMRAPDDVAARLEVRRGTRVVRLRTLGESLGAIGEASSASPRATPEDTAGAARTLTLGEHWFRAARFPGIADAVAATGSISRALATIGVTRWSRRASWVTARLPDESSARLLRQPARRPVLVVECVNVDPAGVPIEFGRTQFVGDAVQLVIEHGG